MRPETADSASSRSDRLVSVAIHASVYLFAIALVSVAGAMVMGSFEHDIRQWGWVAGALIAAIGYPLGYVSFLGLKVQQLTDAEQQAEEARPRQVLGPVKGSLVGILLGVILGIPIWFIVMVFWLSLALSPFTPDGWREGMATGFFAAFPPPMTALLVLGWTWGVLCSIGVALGLCGKMYKYGSADRANY